MTEKQLLEAIRAGARRLGWLAYHTHNSQFSERGFPDLVLARAAGWVDAATAIHPDGLYSPQRVEIRPRLYFLELKGPKGKVSAEQDAWIGALTAAGQRALIVREDDLEWLFRELAGLS